MDEKTPETAAAALESTGSWEALPEPPETTTTTTPTLGSTSPLHDGEVPGPPPTLFGSLEDDPGKVQFRIMPMLLMHGILTVSALLAFGLSWLDDDSFIRHAYRIRVGVGFCLPCLAALIPKEALSRVRVSAAAVCLWAMILVLASEYCKLPNFAATRASSSPCDEEEAFYACLSSAAWAVLCSMPHSLGTTSSIPGSPLCLRLGATIYLAGLATEAAIFYGRAAAALLTVGESDEASDVPWCLLQWSDLSYQPNLVGEVLVWLGILVMNATALVEPPPSRVTNPVVKSAIKYKKIAFAVLGPVAVWNALYAGVVTVESLSKDFNNVALVAERDFERASLRARDAARVAQSRFDELSDQVSITAKDFAQLARAHWEPVSAYVEEVYTDLVGMKQKAEDGTADTTIPLEGSVDEEATAVVRELHEDEDIYEKAKKADDETADQAHNSGVEDDIEGATVAQVADDASNKGQQEDDVAEEQGESTEIDDGMDEQDEDSAADEGQQDGVDMEEENTAIAEDEEIDAEVGRDAADNEKGEILDEDLGQHTEEAEQGDTPEEAAKEEESTDTDAEPIDEEPLDAEGADEEDEVGEPQDGVNIDEEGTAPVGEAEVQPETVKEDESSDGAQDGTGPEAMVHESASQEHHPETAGGEAPPKDENVVKEAEEHIGTQLDEEDDEKVAGDEEQVPIESQDLEELEASTETGDEEQKDANVLEEEADVATNRNLEQGQEDGQGGDEMAEPIVLEDESSQAERVEDKDEEEVEVDRSAGEAEDGSVMSAGDDEGTEMSNTDDESSEQTDTALDATAADDEDGAAVSQTTLEDGPKIDSTSTNNEDASGPVGATTNDASSAVVVEEQVEIPEEYSRVAEERRTATSDAGQIVPDRKTKQRMGPLSKLRTLLFRMKRPDPEEPPPAVVPPNGPQDLWLVDPERVYQ